MCAALIILGISGCDQSSKFAAVGGLTDAFAGTTTLAGEVERFLTVQHPRSTGTLGVVDGFWELLYVENPGIAFFSFRSLPSSVARPLFVLLGLMALAVMARLMWKEPDTLTVIAIALIIGGAVGNLLDRVRLGYVIDFIHWHWGSTFDWPVFNMADAAVVTGGVLLLVRTFARVSPRARS